MLNNTPVITDMKVIPVAGYDRLSQMKPAKKLDMTVWK